MKKIIALVISLFIFVSGICVIAASDNVAVGKSVEISGEANSLYPGSNTVDGDINTFTTTGADKTNGPFGGKQYITVDLLGKYIIEEVNVRSRRDVNNEAYRRGWILYVSNDSNFNEFVEIGRKDKAGAFCSDLETGLLNLKDAYRYVRIVADQHLVVAEIEIYGTMYNADEIPILTDIVDTNLGNAVNLIGYLDIITEIDKNKFGKNKLIMRDEAAKIVAKTANYSKIEGMNLAFNDVTAD